METRLGGDVSLNAPAPWHEDGETQIGDSLPDDGPLPDDLAFGRIVLDHKEMALRSAMDQLDDRERLVVQERWLTEDIAPPGALAEFFGIGARQGIELAVMAKLQMEALSRRSLLA